MIVWLYLVLSLITLLVYFLDKSAAKNKQWRISENTLHILALLGGWPGALLAQQLLRHKSKKVAFQRIFWLTFFVNCALLVWLIIHTK
jgi:uncharacterized membrane protein YsdA (DUF1294 family)